MLDIWKKNQKQCSHNSIWKKRLQMFPARWHTWEIYPKSNIPATSHLSLRGLFPCFWFTCPKHPFLYVTILSIKRYDCSAMGILISPLKYILRLQKVLSRKYQAIYRKHQEKILLILLVTLKLMEYTCPKFLTDRMTPGGSGILPTPAATI